MAKKTNKRSETPKSRTEDRHTSGFMIRLPEPFRRKLDRYREAQQKKHHYKPPRTVLVQLALEEFLGRVGFWDEPDEESD